MKAPLMGLGMLLLAAAPAGMHLMERDQPLVDEGLRAYDRGDFEAALKSFEAAEKELPNNATVELNRGNALFRLGRMDEAQAAYQRAAQLDQGQLQARDEYNLGTTLAQMGKREEAIRALRRSLLKDPTDEQARHNLEVLLRDLPKDKKPSQGDGGTDAGQDAGPNDAGAPDAGQDGGQTGDAGSDGGTDGGADGGTDGGGGDAGADGGQDGGSGGEQGPQKDGGQGDAGQSDGGQGERDGGQDGGEGQQDSAPDLKDFDHQDAGTAQPSMGDLDKQDAERMLDAVRQNERNLQMWKFQQKQRKSREPHDKDW